MGGGAACYVRVCMGPSPRLRRVRHAHAAVFPHATEVRPLHTICTQCTVKRRYSAQTEPSLESNLFVTLPDAFGCAMTLHYPVAQDWDESHRGRRRRCPQSTSPRQEVGPASGLKPKASC